MHKTNKSKLELAEEKKIKLLSYEKVNDKLVYKKINLRKITKKMEEEAVSLKRDGVSVILINNGRQMSFLAPGQDPYAVRKATNKALLREEERAKNQAAKKVSGSKSVTKKFAKKQPFGAKSKKTISI